MQALEQKLRDFMGANWENRYLGAIVAVGVCCEHFEQEIERLQTELVECQEELFIIKRSIIDPENQPSQFGTVTLDMYEALQAQLVECRKERDELQNQAFRRFDDSWKTYDPDQERDQKLFKK
jgi:hypothetical protein